MPGTISMATTTLVPISVHRQRLRPPAVVNSIPILNSSCLISCPIELLRAERAALGEDPRQLGRLLGGDGFLPLGISKTAEWPLRKVVPLLPLICSVDSLRLEKLQRKLLSQHRIRDGKAALWREAQQAHALAA